MGGGDSGGHPSRLVRLGWLAPVTLCSGGAVAGAFRKLQVVLEDRRLAACPEGLTYLDTPNQAALIFAHRRSWRDLRQSQPNQHSDILAYNIPQFFLLQTQTSLQSLREPSRHKKATLQNISPCNNGHHPHGGGHGGRQHLWSSISRSCRFHTLF